MARRTITVSGKGIRKDTVDKIAKAIVEKYGKDDEGDNKASVSVADATPPDSRADRFSAACGLVGDAKSEFESLRDELQEWYDNLPENFQNGDKGNDLQTAIDELENLIQNAEDVESGDVSFPQMY